MKQIFTKKQFFLFLIIEFSFLLLYFLLNNIFLEITFFQLFFLLFSVAISYFLIIYFLEIIKQRDLVKRIDQDLPYFLNNLANNLEKGISLKSALEIESKIFENKDLGVLLKQGLDKINKKGYSLEKAFSSLSIKTENLSRSLYQITDTVTSGGTNKSDNLRTLSKTIIEKQKSDSKRYSTKLNFISLIFIVISAVVPAIFLMFFLIGASFLEFSLSKTTIIFVTVVLFPVIDLFLLLFMRANM
jgi:Flp pilus assembly protein TadB